MRYHNLKARLLMILIGFTIILILSGCSTSEEKQSTAQPVAQGKTYQVLTGDVVVNGHSLRVAGDTDLPNGGRIRVDVIRSVKMAGNKDKLYMNIGQADGIIKNGKYEVSISLNERAIGIIGKPEFIDPNVNIEIMFYPHWYSEDPQSENVLQLVGVDGENLSGPLAVKKEGKGSIELFKYLQLDTSAAVAYR